MIDQDGDGFVDEKDLGKMLQQLGEWVGLQGAAPALADLSR
jgi:Ca2+-binding EF-hand superfamily protein